MFYFWLFIVVRLIFDHWSLRRFIFGVPFFFSFSSEQAVLLETLVSHMDTVETGKPEEATTEGAEEPKENDAAPVDVRTYQYALGTPRLGLICIVSKQRKGYGW